jgi:hypothetical protein
MTAMKTAMKTMASTKTTSVATTEAVATTIEAAPVPAATATGSHQDEWIACCIERLFQLGAAQIIHLRERDTS